MRTRRIVAGAATIAALAGGAAGAVAAGKDERSSERTVLADAAKRLGVTTGELRDALRAAGAVVHVGGRDGHHGHRGGPGGAGGFHDTVAEALGITEEELFDRLRDGQTLAEIAEAEGKTLAQVRSAVRAEAVERLDEAVQDGRITKAQRDEMVEHLDEHLERLGEGPFFGRGGHHGPLPGPRP